MKYVWAYGVALVLFLILDGIWLGFVARNFYASRMGSLMTDSPRWGAAAIFYLLFVVGMVYFAVNAGLQQQSWTVAAMNGAIFGFMAYLTYNGTALAVIRGFDDMLAVVDTFWGAALGAVVSGATVLIMQALGRSG